MENPTLDLEVYAQSCTGLARIYRLIYVADVCPTLRIEALKLALSYIMETYNVSMYQLLHRKLNEVRLSVANSQLATTTRISSSNSNTSLNAFILAANNDTGNNNAMDTNAPNASRAGSLPDVADQPSSGTGCSIQNMDLPVFDSIWVESTSKKSALILEKLDSDLKNFKINSIKESIRRGHDDLGDHYVLAGDLSNALKCYSRARDYCTSGIHVINMCWNVIKVSIYLQNWSHVVSYVSKAENIPDISSGNKENMLVCTVFINIFGPITLIDHHHQTPPINNV